VRVGGYTVTGCRVNTCNSPHSSSARPRQAARTNLKRRLGRRRRRRGVAAEWHSHRGGPPWQRASLPSADGVTVSQTRAEDQAGHGLESGLYDSESRGSESTIGPGGGRRVGRWPGWTASGRCERAGERSSYGSRWVDNQYPTMLRELRLASE
jgi:hypothetical protein